jgi:RING finger protein 26
MLNLADGLTMAKNDFVLFLCDVNDLYETLLKFVSDTGDFIFQVVLSCLNSFQRYLTLIHLLVYAVIDCVLNLLINALLMSKALLILVGNSTLFLLQLGPVFLFYVFCGISSVINWSLQLVWHYIFQTAYGILAFFKSVHYELIDIPPSSMFGVLLALFISLVFFYYLKSIVFYWQKMKNVILEKSWLHMPKFRRPNMLKRSGKIELEKCSNIHLLRQLEQEREDKLCIVCHDQLKCVILLPCRHFCLCQTCVSIIRETDPSCPLCRRFVADSMKVYT